MLTARARRVRASAGLVARLDPRLDGLLHASPALAAVLAGGPGDTGVEVPDTTVAADLLVLLDHLNLHTGARLSVAHVGPGRYTVSGPGDPADAHDAGRVGRIAVITRDRPETLAAGLDAFAANLRTFGREHIGIVVYDDSGPDRRPEIRSVVEARGFRYVGPDEKHALRAEIEAGLPGPVDERTAVLDGLLGRRGADGTWAGSAAAQRNWAILSHAGSRVLVCDDDVRPAVLDAPLDALRAAARTAIGTGFDTALPGDLLETFLRCGEVEAWPTDLVGALENCGPGLVSAAYTGHPDRRTALWLERFFEPCDDSVDVLGTGIPPQRVRRGTPAATGRRFRGGAFVSAGDPDVLEFAVRRGRNEDFSLALSAEITSGGRIRPAEVVGAHILHLRGPRSTGPFAAHREEREGYLVNTVVRAIGAAHAVTSPGPFDAAAFRASGLAALDAELGRVAAVADELFDEGLAYLDRARREPAGPWLDDPSGPHAALMADGVRRLHDRTVPADPVLMECAQVLVPQGLLTTMHPPAMREQWRRLSDVERAEARRCLLEEVRYLASVLRLPARGTSAGRMARKKEQARLLVDDIERELRPGREAFRAGLLRRVRAEIALYLTAVPYVAPVRDRLSRASVEAAR